MPLFDGAQVSEVCKLDELIGLIYDASLDPARWPSALSGAARFVGGPSAALWSKDAAGRTCTFAYDCGFDGGYVEAYVSEYARLDPAATVHFFAGVEEPIAHAGVIPHSAFVETRFYREWARPQGLVDCVNVMLDRSATSVALFGVSRHARDGIADDRTCKRMRLIVPHVRRATLIGKAIDLKAGQAAAFAETLDGITAAIFLVDARGRMIHANAAGRTMLAEREVLRVSGGRLAASDAQASRALDETFTAAGSGDEALGVKGIALPLTARTGDRYVAHVLPLTSGSRRQAGASFAAVAALFVRRATLERPGPLEIIAKTYNLTPTELRVLLAVVEVGGAPDVADALGVAETTVKFHLKRLFEKTDTRRQADLVKIVAGYSSLPAG